MSANENDLYVSSRLNMSRSRNTSATRSDILLFHLREMFPTAEDRALVKAADKAASSSAATSHNKVLDQLKLLSSSYASVDVHPGGLKPSVEVREDDQTELLMRRSESMLSRLLTSGPVVECHSLQNVDRVVEQIIQLKSPESSVRAFEDKKASLGSEAKETLLFYPFSKDRKEFKISHYLCDLPSLSLSFGSGLLLCRVLLGRTATGMDAEAEVPDQSNSLVVGPKQEKICHQPGSVFKVKESSQILPYSLIRLRREFAAIVLMACLEDSEFFTPSSKDAQAVHHSGVTDQAKSLANGVASHSSSASDLTVHAVMSLKSQGAVPKTQPSQPPPKKSRGNKSKVVFKGPLVSHVVQVDDDDVDSSDNCAFCTFCLTEAGMYDDDGSVGGCAQLKECKHVFHENCLKQMLEKSDSFVQCPQCKKIYGLKIGNQPTSLTMSVHVDTNTSLPGYHVDTIVITYSGPHRSESNIQGPEHPNPGKAFYCPAFPRIAYLPNDAKGQKVLRLLKRAFAQRLIFTVGRSTTSGQDNVVTWNDIHHKTQNHRGGEHGYPDPNYLDSVIADLQQHGITEP